MGGKGDLKLVFLCSRRGSPSWNRTGVTKPRKMTKPARSAFSCVLNACCVNRLTLALSTVAPTTTLALSRLHC